MASSVFTSKEDLQAEVERLEVYRTLIRDCLVQGTQGTHVSKRLRFYRDELHITDVEIYALRKALQLNVEEVNWDWVHSVIEKAYQNIG